MTRQVNYHFRCEVVEQPKLLLQTGSENQVDEKFWSLTILPSLEMLMQKAGYSNNQQRKYALFVLQNIIPFLGPAPSPDGTPHFDSFCNDDFSPVELSWNFHGGLSTVRIGFEPIGRLAGTSRDPFNALGPAKVVQHLQHCHPHTSTELWQHFLGDFTVTPDAASAVVARMAPNEHMSSTTISFDLAGDPSPKLYHYPIAKGLSTDEITGELVIESLKRLKLNIMSALDILQAFITETKARHGANAMRFETLSWDAVDLVKTRLKLYVRTPRTSLRATQEILTLGGRLSDGCTQLCVANIRLFWFSVLQIHDDEAELPSSTHRTAGIIFNFELRHNDPFPRPKVYIPVRHYCETDLHIAERLSVFFRKSGLTKVADSYVDDVQSIL